MTRVEFVLLADGAQNDAIVEQAFSIARNATANGVADRITVLRNGRVTGSADPKTATQQSLANLMVGRDVVFQVERFVSIGQDPFARTVDIRKSTPR